MTVYSLAHRLGRLLEIRIWSPVSIAEAASWGKEHNELVDSIKGAYVCFVDLRGAKVFPDDVVSAFVSVMKGEERLVRTGTLLGESPTQGLQVERMIREARHPGRRTFRDPHSLVAWLGQELTIIERGRLVEAVREGDSAARERTSDADARASGVHRTPSWVRPSPSTIVSPGRKP